MPSMHREVPMGTRVIVPAGYASVAELKGTVVGIASMHIIFSYIVLLDEPAPSEYGDLRAVTVPGPQLSGENGENWRLEPNQWGCV